MTRRKIWCGQCCEWTFLDPDEATAHRQQEAFIEEHMRNSQPRDKKDAYEFSIFVYPDTPKE